MNISRLPALRLFFLFPALLFLSAASRAQVTIAPVKIGASSTTSVKVTMQAKGTLGTISVRTMGAEGLDFLPAGGGSCVVEVAG